MKNNHIFEQLLEIFTCTTVQSFIFLFFEKKKKH